MRYSTHAPFNGIGGLRDYAYVRVNQWPMGSPSSLVLWTCRTISYAVNSQQMTRGQQQIHPTSSDNESTKSR